MGWKEHTSGERHFGSAKPSEILEEALALRDPRKVEELVPYLDQHADAIDDILGGRSRWSVLKGESFRGWLFGPLGFVGPVGAIAASAAIGAAWLFQLSFPGFVVAALVAYVLLRLAFVKPDRTDWLARGTTLGAGAVAAWSIRRRGRDAPSSFDGYLRAALIESPEYWHDLSGRAVGELPLDRRERVVLAAFSARSDDLWYLLPLAPTERVVRAALSRGPRSSATADFQAFGALIRRATISPVLEAIRAGSSNRDVLIRAVAASGNPDAVDLLVATLSERNDRLRDVARDGLVSMGPAVIPRLFAAFESGSSRVQQGIARALRGTGPHHDVASFAAARLADHEIDPTAATELRRILLTRRCMARQLRFVPAEQEILADILADIPTDRAGTLDLEWRDGTPLPAAAASTLADLVVSESPERKCPELARFRELLGAPARHVLMELAEAESSSVAYRMVLADEAELLRQHLAASRSRQTAEEWVDVLERHASLASVHCLDELWRTGIDGVVQTSAMAALMRLSGEYDGLETFADRALHDALEDAAHPLHEPYARGQFARFEQMMIGARRVSENVFWSLYDTVPAQSVLWGGYDRNGGLRGTFRLDEEYEAVDEDDEPYLFEPHVQIGIVHPAELGPVASANWAEVFSDYELVPHFEQLHRPAWHLHHEDTYQTLFQEFSERAPGSRLERALIRRGWRPSPTDIETVYTLTKPVQRGRSAFTAVIDLEPGFGEDPDEVQEIECLAFWPGHHHVLSSVVTKVPLTEVDAVVFSEIVLELRQVLEISSTGEERSLPTIPSKLD